MRQKKVSLKVFEESVGLECETQEFEFSAGAHWWTGFKKNSFISRGNILFSLSVAHVLQHC